jgi:hypothetical protein
LRKYNQIFVTTQEAQAEYEARRAALEEVEE